VMLLRFLGPIGGLVDCSWVVVGWTWTFQFSWDYSCDFVENG
jgi:hypothetical protein